MKKKRDYSKCFQCGSSDLWSAGKQRYCHDCQGSVDTKPRWVNEKLCLHLGKKEYFAICFACYQQVPIKGNLKDWNWIIKQQELTNHE